MEKIKVEVGYAQKETVEILKAYEGHYEVEFTFKGKRFYLVVDYKEDGSEDARVYTESEFLLADEPETMYRVCNGKEIDRLPELGMYSVLFDALMLGREKAESGDAILTLGW